MIPSIQMRTLTHLNTNPMQILIHLKADLNYNNFKCTQMDYTTDSIGSSEHTTVQIVHKL